MSVNDRLSGVWGAMELGCVRCCPQGAGRAVRGTCGVRKRVLVGGEWRAGQFGGLDWAHRGSVPKVNGQVVRWGLCTESGRGLYGKDGAECR